MSRIQELKNHNPHWSKNLIDYIEIIFKGSKSKYVELFVNLLKNWIKNGRYNFQEWREELVEFGIDRSIVDSFNDLELIYFSRCTQSFIPKHELEKFKEFINLNEKSLIDNKDITTIKSFNEVNDLVSLAEIKNWSKELESQIIVELDNPETGWLLVRPLTYEASKKYGSSTKWCTTEKHNSNYFYQYYKNILVYCINRKTGYKIAMNHNVYDNETSFWNATDQRVDSLLTELDSECRLKLVELINKGVSNYELTPEEFRKLEESELTEREDYTVPVVELVRPQVRMVENDLVVRGNGITTTGDNVININPPTRTNGNNVITVNPPNGIRVYERPANINLTYDLDTILPQMDISDWVKDIASDLPNNTEPQNNE
jgi:hypothetical protein